MIKRSEEREAEIRERQKNRMKMLYERLKEAEKKEEKNKND
jgi:hypothetical protein